MGRCHELSKRRGCRVKLELIVAVRRLLSLGTDGGRVEEASSLRVRLTDFISNRGMGC